ncbi:MAG: hypothetical protein LBS03_04655 [Bacteroidales bacterium]|jgi:hypothetical protein|nr:hypothetical protein [Bacteroidales bacterium]
MLHQQYTEYLTKELGFLRALIARIHEQETIADVELDLALTKMQGIYEHMLKLKLIHHQLAKADKGTQAQQVEEAVPEVTTPPPTENKMPEYADDPEIQPVIPAVDIPHEKAKCIPAPEEKNVENKIVENKIVEEKIVENVAPRGENVILADKIRPVGYSPINETLAQKKAATDLAGKLQATPLDNISAGIGVNDKFLYIRELFRNDGNLFGETVRKIDKAGSLEEAMNLTSAFNWNRDLETVQKFLSLIRRKHAAH